MSSVVFKLHLPLFFLLVSSPDLHHLLLGLLWSSGNLGLFGFRVIDRLGHRMLQRDSRVNGNNGVHLETLHTRKFFRHKPIEFLRPRNSIILTDTIQSGWMRRKVLGDAVEQAPFRLVLGIGQLPAITVVFDEHSYPSRVPKILRMRLIQLQNHRQVERATRIGNGLC